MKTLSIPAATNMELFIYVIVGSMLLLFLFRAAIGYRHYRKSIFPHIYDNYLFDYFYKLNVFQDASKSGLIRKLIGYHRIVYANIANKEGKLASQILTIIHTKGILCISYLNSEGIFNGKDSGDWIIRRTEENEEKKYRIDNPVIYLREYLKHLNDVLGERRVESVIAVSDAADISNLHATVRVVHFSDLSALIKEADCGYGLNSEEIDEIFTKLGGKLSR